MGESCDAIPTEIIAARDASAIDLKAIRQAMNEPESSFATCRWPLGFNKASKLIIQ